MQARNPNNAQGIDISHWQGVIDWDLVHNSGVSFAYLKCTEGLGIKDRLFDYNLAKAKQAGVIVGAYHFCRAATVDQALDEADYFCKTIENNKLDLPPALDIETAEGKTKEDITAICHAWIDRVKQLTGIQPILYTYVSFARMYLGNSLADTPLWFARYDIEKPEDVAGWKEWTFLQYTSGGTVPGIKGNVDLNEFMGGVEEMFGKTLKKEDANSIIKLLSGAYGVTADKEAKEEFHRLANELRKASGQQIQ